jgi:hypothetical protein
MRAAQRCTLDEPAGCSLPAASPWTHLVPRCISLIPWFPPCFCCCCCRCRSRPSRGSRLLSGQLPAGASLCPRSHRTWLQQAAVGAAPGGGGGLGQPAVFAGHGHASLLGGGLRWAGWVVCGLPVQRDSFQLHACIRCIGCWLGCSYNSSKAGALTPLAPALLCWCPSASLRRHAAHAGRELAAAQHRAAG